MLVHGRGIMLGLLTVGSMLSSPLHPQLDTPTSGSLQQYSASIASADAGYGFPSMQSPYYGGRSRQYERPREYEGSEVFYGAPVSPLNLSRSGRKPLVFSADAASS